MENKYQKQWRSKLISFKLLCALAQITKAELLEIIKQNNWEVKKIANRGSYLNREIAAEYFDNRDKPTL